MWQSLSSLFVVRILLVSCLVLLAGPVAAAQNGGEYYPRLSQGYLSSPENAFLLTGMCEKYLWDYPTKRSVREFAVESLHLGNVVGVRFNDNGQVNSCYSYDFEVAFSYQDGRINKSTLFKVANGVLDNGIESVYEYSTDDPDRVEVWSYTSKGKKIHRATYLLDGFELTVVNERMNSKVVKTYDHLGRLVQERSDYATFVYDYNNEGFMVLESAGKQGQQPERNKIISYTYATDGNIDMMKTQTVDATYRADYLFHILR